MRVLHFYSTYYPDTVGGAEAAISQICQSTSKFGVISTVMALSVSASPRRLRIDGHDVVRCKTNFEIASTRFSFSAFTTLRQLANEHDVVHYHFPWPFADFCQIALRLRNPYLVTYHSDVVKQKFLLKLYAPLMHRFLRGAAQLVATSPNYLETSDVLKTYRSKVSIIPLALSSGSYVPATLVSQQRWRTLLGDQPFFLFVGVLRYYKGLHLLIEAVRGSNLKVVIAGDGPEAYALHQQAHGLKNVVFLGRISEDDKVALLTIAYGFVFPSHLRSEAFGMSLLEAGLFGLPSICFDLGTGTTYVVEDGVSGIVAGRISNDVSGSASLRLRNAMNSLIADPAMARRLGSAAQTRIGAMFNVALLGKNYSRVYEKIVEQSTRKTKEK
jgi:O-antigen biosynthesis rhamnosyltransferase